MIKRIIFIFAIAIIYSCATVQSPTGGEKDEKAPILYESNPKDQSVNFKETEIKLFFNEWMKLEQLKNELIITPREEIEYEATLDKQKLVIELEEPLKDSTTYTFNFRKALKDITEGNLWEQPIIAFSTGPYLDSLEITGNVKSIQNNTLMKEYLVGLYDTDYDTANLRQGKPTYFTTTDENGSFSMKNLKAGTYKLYTFKDSNDDLINNSQAEPYGFHPEIIELYDSIGQVTLNTYKRNEDTLKLKKYSPVGKDFVIQYNKGLSKYKIMNPKDSNQHIYTNDIENSKYLKIYKENFPDLAYEKDSTLLIVHVSDSIGSERTDSVYFNIRESRLTNDSIKIINQPESKIISGPQQFQFSFSKPIKSINYDSIQLRFDSIPIYQFQKDEISLNYNKKMLMLQTIIEEDSIKNITDSIRTLLNESAADSTENTVAKDSLSIPNKEKQKVDQQIESEDEDQNTPSVNKNRSRSSQTSQSGTLHIYFGKAAFLGIENDSSNRNQLDLTFKKPEKYGLIKGKVIEPDFPFIIELMDEKYQVIDTIVNQTEYSFNLIAPGKYRLRLIKDSNGNQKWDAGNPLLLMKEEEIIYYNEEITVKANWEIIDKNFDFSVDNEVDNGEKLDDL